MKKIIFASIIASFLFVGLNAHAGTPTMPPSNAGCCQFSNDEGALACADTPEMCPVPPMGFSLDNFFLNEVCNEATGSCEQRPRNVPALSEWGLIAMAGVLGIIAYLILRRRKAAA